MTLFLLKNCHVQSFVRWHWKKGKRRKWRGAFTCRCAFEVKQPQASLVSAFICLGERHVCVKGLYRGVVGRDKGRSSCESTLKYWWEEVSRGRLSSSSSSRWPLSSKGFCFSSTFSEDFTQLPVTKVLAGLLLLLKSQKRQGSERKVAFSLLLRILFCFVPFVALLSSKKASRCLSLIDGYAN